MKTTLIGKATRLGEKDFFFVKDENDEVYFCKDVDALCNAERKNQIEQRVKRFISNTVFTDHRAIEFIFYNEHKETKKELQRIFWQDQADDKLSAIVSLAEGADTSDIEKFIDIVEVQEYRELKEMGSSISAGLGFPGKGFGLIFCTENHFYFGRRTKIFLEIVHSYMEGYAVEHQELTPELFSLMNLNIITKEDFRVKKMFTGTALKIEGDIQIEERYDHVYYMIKHQYGTMAKIVREEVEQEIGQINPDYIDQQLFDLSVDFQPEFLNEYQIVSEVKKRLLTKGYEAKSSSNMIEMRTPDFHISIEIDESKDLTSSHVTNPGHFTITEYK